MNEIQALYVAYFSRPGDKYGYEFWADQYDSADGSVAKQEVLGQISALFSQSAEYAATYAGMDTTARVLQIYQNLFNRVGEPDGVNYWVNAIDTPNSGVTISNAVTAILNAALAEPAGAQDRVAVESKVAAAAAFTEALDTPAEYGGYAGTGPALLAKAWLAPIDDAASLAAATGNAAVLDAAIATVVATPSSTHILEVGQDTANGGSGNDIFSATQATLNLGDIVHGGAGQDKLTLSIGVDPDHIVAFAADSLEVFEVKSFSTGLVTIDFSDVDGLNTIVSRETDGASLTFRDIQSVNDVNISIIDTDETHNFVYDANAYTTLGVDVAELRLQEIRLAEINFATVGGTLGKSLVDQLNIDSETIVDPALDGNIVSDLNVGDNLKTILITGNADLRIVAPLDPNLELVDAHGLNAKLRLDLSAEALDSTVIGAQGDTYLDFGMESHAKKITTFGGNDTILAVRGFNDIDSGAGNDTISSGVANDKIVTGAGNDVVSDLGGNNDISTGDGNDVVTIYDAGNTYTDRGNNKVDLGSGNDRLVMDAHDLEVYDTIIGGSGTDTIQLTNTGSSVALGHVFAAETQQTSGIEVFDLRDSNIQFQVTDHLLSTAENNSLTVRTIDATGPQIVDIRGITTPLYHVTLEGGVHSDTVLANETTVNGLSPLHFGDGNGVDTLVIYGDEELSASDSDTITGLEKIVLTAVDNNPTTWQIDVDNHLLEQTSSTLIIEVSPDVPQNSTLYINSVISDLDTAKDLVVRRNSNVTVFVNGVQIVASGVVSNVLYQNAEATGLLTIENELHFTTNDDSLLGSDVADTFYADSLFQLANADFADGQGSNDTLVLGAGLYNGLTLWEQFDHAVVQNIEILEISQNPGYANHFADSATQSYNFNTFKLGNANDVVDEAQTGHTFNTYDGNDVVTLAAGALGVVVNGHGGSDQVHFTESTVSGSSSVSISEVEYVHGSLENNTVTILDSNTVAVTLDLLAGNDTVEGSINADTLTVNGGSQLAQGTDVVHGNGGNDTLNVQHVELIYGDAGSDTITTTHDAAGDTADTVWGGAGDDFIILQNIAQDMIVFGNESSHPTGVDVSVDSGFDTISNFSGRAVDLTVDDLLNVYNLLEGGAIDSEYGNLFQAGGIDLRGGTDNNVAVIWNADSPLDFSGNTFVSIGALTAGQIGIEDNGEAVIAYTSDADGDNVAEVTLAYVCDTDVDSGQSWDVTLIGTVTFDGNGLLGLESGSLVDNFVNTVI